MKTNSLLKGERVTNNKDQISKTTRGRSSKNNMEAYLNNNLDNKRKPTVDCTTNRYA